MTARYFTPRDVALDLARRTQLDRMRLAGFTSGHPLEIARAVRSLAAVRGRDPGGRDLVAWEPAFSPSPSGQAQAESAAASGFVVPPPFVVPSFPQSAMMPRSPAMRRAAPLGTFRVTEDAPGEDLFAAGAMPGSSGTWHVADPSPMATPVGAQAPSLIGAPAPSGIMQSGFAQTVGGTAALSGSGGPNVVSPGPSGPALSLRAGKFLNVAVKLDGTPDKLGLELRQTAKQVAETAISRSISSRGGYRFR